MALNCDIYIKPKPSNPKTLREASRQGDAAEPILEALSLGARLVCQGSQGRT